MGFLEKLSDSQKNLIQTFVSPIDIQNYLDSIPYVGEELNRTPQQVLEDRQCHCLDGGLLAAAALRVLGFQPLIMDLVPEPGTDDDHVLAIFKHNQCYGAIAKSNFAGLRYREPVYTSLRELSMSYFEMFYNIEGDKTLRGYTRPFNLTRFDRYDWETTRQGVDFVVERFYKLKSTALLDEDSIRFLSPVDRRSYEAGMLGANYDGVYKPAVGL
jgi:hypothetical protein